MYLIGFTSFAASSRATDSQNETSCAFSSFVIFFCLLSFSQVSVEEGEDRAKAEGIMFIETSAKGGYNIKVHYNGHCGAQSSDTCIPSGAPY